MRQPSSGVLGLDLAVGPPVRSQGFVQVRRGVLVDDPFPCAPCEEGAGAGAATVNGVVGWAAVRAEADEVWFRQLRRVSPSGAFEEQEDGSPVLPCGAALITVAEGVNNGDKLVGLVRSEEKPERYSAAVPGVGIMVFGSSRTDF